MLAFLHCAVARITLICNKMQGHTVAHLIETLRYKPEGHGFESCCVIDINLHFLESTQPTTYMSTNAGSCG